MKVETLTNGATPGPTDSGFLSVAELEKAVRSGGIDTVITVFPDLYGRLVGKRIAARFFLNEVLHAGMHVCDYLLACDIAMEPVSGYQFASWDKGYGDMLCRPDLRTLRRAAWLESSAIVLCDVYDEATQDLVPVAPRAVLRRQLDLAMLCGARAMAGSELELFIFGETYESARAKSYGKLKTFGPYVEDYHILQGTRGEPLVGAIRRNLEASGIEVESSKGEWGPGQHEINLRYADCLEMADRHVLYKHAAKEIAAAQGLAVSFMAKWHPDYAGNGCHLHMSLWDGEQTGQSLFSDPEAEPAGRSRARTSTLFLSWIAGILAHAREITLFLAPYVNSYKRFHKGTFAPTSIGWAYDNRTAAVRVVGHGRSLRSECRIPGADCNPYLAYAAILAAGLDGIQQGLTPPSPFDGNLYVDNDVPQLPRTLQEAIEIAKKSGFLRKALGDQVLDHYLHFARTELQKYERSVTDWEKMRYFELV